MKIQICRSRLLSTITTGFVALGILSIAIGLIVCLVGGHITVRQTHQLPLGFELWLSNTKLSGIKGAGLWVIINFLYVPLYTLFTWITIRLGLWLASKCPGIELEEIK